MTPDEITSFLSHSKNKSQNDVLRILFKKRTTVDGIIIREKDFEDLKDKNFWRVVFIKDIPLWKDTRNTNLSRIFNGRDFKKLAHANLDLSPSFE